MSAPQPDNHTEEPVVSTALNISVIIGTIIFPLIGFLMGFAYSRRDHPDARKAGKTWLIFAAAVILAHIFLIITMQRPASSDLS